MALRCVIAGKTIARVVVFKLIANVRRRLSYVAYAYTWIIHGDLLWGALLYRSI